MKSSDRRIKISKFLSYHLRHRPDMLGLELAPGGWVEVEKLLIAAKKHRFALSLEELQETVESNDKQRFSFDNTGRLIRANQGHSIEVDLQLQQTEPPDTLYHGTYSKVVDLIQKQGLKKMSRHHVHLATNITTAKKVGSRRGYPVVFQVDTLAMSKDNYIFYCTDNGVWLTESVPPQYLQKLNQ